MAHPFPGPGGGIGAAPLPRVRPSGWWYVAAVGVAVLGLVLAGFSVRQGFRDAESAAIGGTPGVVGTDQPLTFNRAASTTVAYVGPTVVFDDTGRQDLIADLDVRIVDAASGVPVTLADYDGYRPIDLTDETQEGQYVPLFTVRFEPGDYVLSTDSAPGVDRQESSVYVSESIYRKLRGGARRAVALLGGGALLALVLISILARTRGRAKRARQALLPPPAPWPVPGGWSPPAPWGASPGGWPPSAGGWPPPPGPPPGPGPWPPGGDPWGTPAPPGSPPPGWPPR